jgi:hypothetical protein
LDGNFKTLKVNDAVVATSVDVFSINTSLANKLDTSTISDKSLVGNFAQLKLFDTSVATTTDLAAKLNTSKIGDQTLDGMGTSPPSRSWILLWPQPQTSRSINTTLATKLTATDIAGKLDSSKGR